MEFDSAGWAIGRVDPLRVTGAWSLLSPDPEARVDAQRWAHQAATFFGAELSVVQRKAYPGGTLPIADALEVDIAPRGGAATRVLVVTVPVDRAPAVRSAAIQGVAAIGGAGMDALVARARRVWQARAEVRADAPGSGDPRAPLALAAVLAAVMQAPIVPPDEVAIFGVKGARTRLEARGWRT